MGAIHEEAAEAAAGRDVWLVGGGNVASQYLEADLLDVVRVTIVPAVLGAGLPLFAGAVAPMRLVGMTPSDNGMAEPAYEIAT
ncbi:MAG: hypothetical protein EDQ89_01770 [Acidobacteria bacterium]|nr:MAG: hypothetical protein EDQ89_01770 [Acidobacteriota bacterium]